YMLAARRWLGKPTAVAGAPRASLANWIDEYQLAGREFRLRVREDSALVGRTLQDLDLRASAGINLLTIERRERFGRRLIQPTADSWLEADDVLRLDACGPQMDSDGVRCCLGRGRLPY